MTRKFVRGFMAVPAALAAIALSLTLTGGAASAAPAGVAQGGHVRAAGGHDSIEPQVTKSCISAPTSCNTPSVRPYPQGYIGYFVSTGILGCDYRVRDMTLNKVIRSGRIVFSGGGNIFGLTNVYRLEIFGCAPGALGVINGSPV